MSQNEKLETIDLATLSTVQGGASWWQNTKDAAKMGVQMAGDYLNPGRLVQRGYDAVQGYNDARKAGATPYESVGNGAIRAYGLEGGFGPGGQPRPNQPR